MGHAIHWGPDVESQYDYFGARYYDARVGRWLSVDPMALKYCSWSPYHYAANNPVHVIDPNGLDWRIQSNSSEDHSAVMGDLKELVGTNNLAAVQVGRDGTVSLDMSRYEVVVGGGSELVYDLVTSPKSYTFEVASQTTVTGMKSSAVNAVNLDDPSSIGISNQGGMQNKDMASPQPTTGEDGKVVITRNAQWTQDGNSVARTNIVFHELKENYLKVDKGVPRGDNNDPGSAHRKAGAAGKMREKIDKLGTPQGAEGGYPGHPIGRKP
jgi:RHS repeat-associated protein